MCNLQISKRPKKPSWARKTVIGTTSVQPLGYTVKIWMRTSSVWRATTADLSSEAHSSSKPWFSNFSVLQFSVTVRTMFSGAPDGISASISIVIFTFASSKPARC
jgi:hypothetical protein